MTPVLEEVLEKVNTLSSEELAKVREALDAKEREAEQQRHAELVRSLKGKYKDVMPGPELRRKWKEEEIELEDKGWQPKDRL